MLDLAEQILRALLDGRVPAHLVAVADELRMALMEKVREAEGYQAPPDPHPAAAAWEPVAKAPPGPAPVLSGKALPAPVPGTRPRGRPRIAQAGPPPTKADLAAILGQAMQDPPSDPRRSRLDGIEAFPEVLDLWLN